MKVKQQTNKCKAEPRAPLCPLAGFAPCRKAKCAWWDDDWLLCSVHYGSVYSSIRSATVDAAVEVAKGYGTLIPSQAKPETPSHEGEGFGMTENRVTGKPGTSSVTALCAVPPSPTGEGFGTTANPYCSVRLFKRSASLADTEV